MVGRLGGWLTTREEGRRSERFAKAGGHHQVVSSKVTDEEIPVAS